MANRKSGVTLNALLLNRNFILTIVGIILRMTKWEVKCGLRITDYKLQIAKWEVKCELRITKWDVKYELRIAKWEFR